jgi:hypothetical protein
MSEEEFGPPGDGPITLPCNAVFMEHVVSSFQGIVDEEMEKVQWLCQCSVFVHHLLVPVKDKLASSL